VAAALVPIALLSCAPHRAYRIPEDRIQTSSDRLRDDAAHRAEVERHCVEEHSEFSLGFVEFDDQGDLWEPEQVLRLERLILEEGSGPDNPGVIVVVFVHGWKHNAGVCDGNVTCFRDLLTGLDNLERLQAHEQALAPRRLIGVYLGWRGLSARPPVLRELSFYGRKATAHRVGEGRVVEVLSRLEALRDRLNDGGGRSRLIIVGHSFGGAVTFTALSSVFEDRLARSLAEGASESGHPLIDGFGDLVVLVNPAFEATLFTGIHEQSFARDAYPPHQPAALLVVTSESDSATRKAFPAGRTLGTLFATTRSKEQKKALRTAVGHYLPYRTDFLSPAAARSVLLPDLVERSEAEARGAADCTCRYIEVNSLTSEQIQLAAGIERAGFAGVGLEPVNDGAPDFNPFPVVGTTDEIVTEHNGIYNRAFIDFLRAFLLEMERRRSREEIDPGP
jgi:pimeloyl-ACP methyl ester carboxylesterase